MPSVVVTRGCGNTLDRASTVTPGSAELSVAVARPSLDDVYLRHTGRRYSESESPGHDGHASELDTVGVSK